MSGAALVALLAAATALPAEAQRRTEWQIGVGQRSQRGHVGVSVGSNGVHINAGYQGRHQRPVVNHCPPPVQQGYWETRYQRVWVPGPVRQIWVPEQYAVHYDACGRAHQYLVRPGYWDTIQEQGYWENRPTQVWVPYRAISTR